MGEVVVDVPEARTDADMEAELVVLTDVEPVVDDGITNDIDVAALAEIVTLESRLVLGPLYLST